MPEDIQARFLKFLFLLLLVPLSGTEGPCDGQADPSATTLRSDLSSLLESFKGNPDSRNEVLNWLDSESEHLQSDSDLLDEELATLESSLEVLEAKVGAGRRRTRKNEVLPAQIKSILAENCFACHGPDSGQRKAGLRLDDGRQIFEEAKSGGRPVIPGNPTESLLIKRITSSDPDERMPPAESGKVLSEEDRALLVRWVAEGAEWEAHWAFIPPREPDLPAVRDESWPRNPIDRFVLARLEQEGFAPSPEADRYTLIRRVLLDLTGLPPTPEEVEDFVTDSDPEAYETLVGRLLASSRYGEQMARYWLDLARYADTNGYAADIERTMWRYRDWVIGAFNANKPFDQFTIEQLAGDLLPNPTLDQRIATGFNRNHPIMMEGGAIFEEYRVANVVDRVDTTATTWLGLTMKCAQCHDHKYDPISQREFYSFYSFFNNVTEEESRLFGTELDGNSLPRIQAPTPDQQAELARLEEALDEVRMEMLRPIPQVDESQRVWEGAERTEIETEWTAVNTVITSASPEGEQAKETITLEGDTTHPNITALRIDLPRGEEVKATNPAFSLSELELFVAPSAAASDETRVEFANVTAAGPFRAIHSAAAPFGFEDRTHIRVALRGDGLSDFADRLRFRFSNDAAFLPSTLGSWYVNGPFVAKSGEEAWNAEQVDPSHIDLSATYEDGRVKWTTPTGGFPDGTAHSLSGKSCATYFHRTITAPTPRRMDIALDNRNAVRLWLNGRLVFDKEAQRGEVAAHPAPATLQLRKGENSVLIKTADYYDFNSHTFYFARTGEEVGRWPLEIEDALLLAPNDRTEDQELALREFYRSRHWEGWGELFDRQQDLEWARAELEKQIPTTMVMEEMKEPRPTHVLTRGQYDLPGDPVPPGVPALLNAWPEGAPMNRLGLAQWLVAPENPLTARVTVNRVWQRYFGAGLVTTPDDFGVQGARPSHPDLLDWLACAFIDSGWDMKTLQRLIVTSATYRQSSRTRPELLESDPHNRLLARGPRYRLEAEQIRDNALAAGGLLVEKVGGPSVKPYQPAGIWRDVAYGGGGQRYTAQEFVQDHGADLYRRSLYTFWKRAAAAPNMLLFDAPNREVCTARRSRSNTPLQSLVLMNDTQYVEAARALSARVMKESGPSVDERIEYASLLALSRPPRPAEETALRKQYEEQLADYRASPDTAKALLETGESEADEKLDPAELAAWTLVASALLNTDAAVSQF